MSPKAAADEERRAKEKAAACHAGANTNWPPRSLIAMSTTATTETKPAAPVIEKIKVKVDGREIEVPKLMPDRIRQADAHHDDSGRANWSKTDVPHYCYHPKLPVAGNCRMCLVEFGTPGARAGPQAGFESRWHAEDREIAAPGHCLRHARFRPAWKFTRTRPA